MFESLKRMGRYFKASMNSRFNERADPKIQLEQAIAEAQDQHRKLTEQAANVIANHKQTEIRLNRAMEEMEKVTGSARQALVMANEAQLKGNKARADELTRAAENFANRLVATESEVESLKQLSLQSAEAASQARNAVATNSAALQAKLVERQKLLSQLDQAKMQEQMNSAMTSLSASIGAEVPTLDEVRNKIETRYAKALGMSELQGVPAEASMIEISRAQIALEAQSKLDEIRLQLGLQADSAAIAADEKKAALGTGSPSAAVAGSAGGNGEATAEPVTVGEESPETSQENGSKG